MALPQINAVVKASVTAVVLVSMITVCYFVTINSAFSVSHIP